jgi:hypothetical protein
VKVFRLSFLSVDGVTSGGSAKFWLDPRSPNHLWNAAFLFVERKRKSFCYGGQLLACLPFDVRMFFFFLELKKLK